MNLRKTIDSIYPSLDVLEAVCEYAHEEDADIRSIAIKTLKRLEKEVNK